MDAVLDLEAVDRLLGVDELAVSDDMRAKRTFSPPQRSYRSICLRASKATSTCAVS